jgi:hypothetical protein
VSDRPQELSPVEAVRILDSSESLIEYADGLADRADVFGLHTFAELLAVEWARARSDLEQQKTLADANEASARRAIERERRLAVGVGHIRDELVAMAPDQAPV